MNESIEELVDRHLYSLHKIWEFLWVEELPSDEIFFFALLMNCNETLWIIMCSLMNHEKLSLMEDRVGSLWNEMK